MGYGMLYVLLSTVASASARILSKIAPSGRNNGCMEEPQVSCKNTGQ